MPGSNMSDSQTVWSYNQVDDLTNRKLLKLLHGENEAFIQVGPNGYFFPKKFGKDGLKYHEFLPKSTDTWIVTFPRSGTTLMQELVWLLCNKFDYETAAAKPLTERFPFLEFPSCVNKQLLDELLSAVSSKEQKELLLEVTGDCLEKLKESEERRFIKTHLPFSLLHPSLLNSGAKVIYVARNPKDVAISYYHLHKLFKTLDFQGTFPQFWKLFTENRLLWCPFWKHIEEGWTKRDNPNLLFLFYEDIKTDLKATIEKVATFLNVQPKPAEISKLIKHLDIRIFGQNASVNFENLRPLGILNETEEKFIRKGGSSNETTKEQQEWIERNEKLIGIEFPKAKN